MAARKCDRRGTAPVCEAGHGLRSSWLDGLMAIAEHSGRLHCGSHARNRGAAFFSSPL